MAKRLSSFPGDTTSGPKKKYPWDEWTDGSVWEIRRGIDYDVATENMRVNLHIKADSALRKVRTQKFRDERGEGLVFQFLDSKDTERVKQAVAHDPAHAETAIKQLYADAIDIYERARREVTINRKDGGTQKYAAVRFKQQIERGYDTGMLVPTVANIIRKRTTGFDHLEEAGRGDLMLETLVVDTDKPYHKLFTPTTIDVARARLDGLGPSRSPL